VLPDASRMPPPTLTRVKGQQTPFSDGAQTPAGEQTPSLGGEETPLPQSQPVGGETARAPSPEPPLRK